MNIDPRKTVIVQILPALENGGVERGVIDITKALKKADFVPIVISKGGVLTYQLKEADIEHINLDVSSKNPFKIYKNIKKLYSIFIENGVDIVHVRSRAPMWSAYFACKKSGTKLISTIHGPYSLAMFGCKKFFLKKVYNQIMLKADKVIAVSNFIKNYIVENYNYEKPDEITVIQRGVDLNYFNKEKVSQNRVINLSKKWHLPEDKKVIFMPARFTSWKGHEFLIDALAKVKNNFICIMAGSDHGHREYRKKLELKIVKEGLEGKIKIAGICKDMPAAYILSDFVICPSIRPEAFGRIPIEAQSSGKIIVATKIGGALETVIDGKTGFLVEPGNIDEMAKKIDNILEMPKEEAKKMGMNARKHVELNFSNEKLSSETINIYRNSLSWISRV
jgi:glycosyltransferase involved in cell wall biosynthesis